MIPPGDTDGMTFKDHAPMLILAALWIGFLVVIHRKDTARQPAAAPPATQEFYEREKANDK